MPPLADNTQHTESVPLFHIHAASNMMPFTSYSNYDKIYTPKMQIDPHLFAADVESQV